MKANRIPLLLAALLSISSFLWTCLLPPWEGFDEAQHYSYVRSLASDAAFPRLGPTPITEEVWQSLLRTPVSLSVQQNYPMLTSFDEARQGIVRDPPGGGLPHNYEAHQAPLAYLLILPLDQFIEKTGIDGGLIETRLKILRFVLLIASGTLLWVGAGKLISNPLHRYCALFLVFTTEMFYGAGGHVANDWLAIPLFVLLFVELLTPSWRAGLVFSAGLLTKAYFLALAPLFILIMKWRSIPWLLLAAPWYVRNMVLYGNLSGMQEQLEGISMMRILEAVRDLPWIQSQATTYRNALWLANNSFLQWSELQLTVLCALVLAAFLVSISRTRYRITLLLYLLSFMAAIAYAALQGFIYTRGGATAASPWYATPVWILILVTMNAGHLHKWIRGGFVAVWAYWFVATFWIKLLPWYGGVLHGRSSLRNISVWYGPSFSALVKGVGGWTIIVIALLMTMTTITLACILVRRLRLSGEGDEAALDSGG